VYQGYKREAETSRVAPSGSTGLVPGRRTLAEQLPALGAAASKADGEHSGAPAGPAVAGASSTAAPAAKAGEPKLGQQATGDASGSVADVVTPEGLGRSGCEAGDTAAKDDGAPIATGNVAVDLGVGFSQPETALDGGKQDAAVSNIGAVTLSQPGGLALTEPFGKENYEPAFQGVAWALAAGKCTINATLHAKCPWGTFSGGRTDVPSATDAVVTAAKAPDIMADLAPGKDSPHKSQRENYYSQKLVEQHETFHGTDDFGWTVSSGKAIAKAVIEAGTVTAATAAADVTSLLDKARHKLIDENWKWYKGSGSSHDSYAGEIRAYANGRAQYQALADAVDRQGRNLRNLEASAEAAASAPAGPAGPLAGVTTADLIARARTAAPADKPAIDAEIAKRNILVYVKVKTADDCSKDEVYLRLTHGGKSFRTAEKSIAEGSSRGFFVSLGGVAPIGAAPLNIKVYDADSVSADDLIVHLDWSAPFAEGHNTRSWDGANYEVWVKMEK